MNYQSVFKRYEIKYVLTLNQAEELKVLMSKYMTGDPHGNNTICNIYLDTPDYLLIRRSIDKPVYKEKIRFRCYGVGEKRSNVYCELKKKYDSVVYKRRLAIASGEFDGCCAGIFPDTQIGRELAFCFKRYAGLQPRVFLSYEREAFYAKDDGAFRITFDKNIMWRDYDLSFTKGVYGNRLLDCNSALMEIKTASAIPLWLARFLSENRIYKTSFSKYGKAYAEILTEKTKGDVQSA